MTINLDNKGLKSIIENYDLFFIDLWGVVHNGVKLNEKAIDALEKISETKKNYILVTNEGPSLCTNCLKVIFS